jgi:hypothetical protein
VFEYEAKELRSSDFGVFRLIFLSFLDVLAQLLEFDFCIRFVF